MNDEEERPLLNEDGDSHASDTFVAPKSGLFSSLRAKSSSKQVVENYDSPSSFFNFAEKEEASEPDLIASVFVVAFDTHCGEF